MALVDVVSFGLKDFTGSRKTLPWYVPSGSTLAQLQAMVDVFAPDIDAVVDSQITDVLVTLALTLPGGLKSSPVAGNTVREGALLTAEAASTIYSFDIFVPSFANGKFTGNLVNDADTDVAALYTVITGPGVGYNPPTDKDGNDLTAISKGVRTFRK